MANTKSSNFAVTCSLLSQFMKEKGTRALGDLAFSSLASKADAYRPPTTMSLLPGVDVSADTKDEVSVPMELFPQRAGLGLNSLVGDAREPENPQLTIFYGGKVLVFDNFPADKANELIQLAANKSEALPAADPTAVATATEPAFTDHSPNFGSAPASSLPIAKSQPLKPTQAIVSNLPIARKASLHRFLEKRKDRINAKAPYQAKDTLVDPTKAEESQPWLGLKPNLNSERIR